MTSDITSGGHTLLAQWNGAGHNFVQDNSASGSGELFGFVWDPTATTYVLVKSSTGATWTTVTGTGTFGQANLLGMDQDSAGAVHLAWWTSSSGVLTYGRVALSYTSGAITGFSLTTSFNTPIVPNVTADMTGSVQVINGSLGDSILVWVADSPSTTQYRVRACVAATPTPAVSADFTALDGTAGSTLAINASAGANQTAHNWQANMAQIGTGSDLYLVVGPRDTGDNTAGSPVQKVQYMRFTYSLLAGTWSTGALTDITTESNSYIPYLYDVVGTENYLWIYYHDPTAGHVIARINSTGTINNSLTSFASAGGNEVREGFGALSVNAAETGIWVWFTTETTALTLIDNRAGAWFGSGWSFTTQTAPTADPFNSNGVNVSAKWRHGLIVNVVDDPGSGGTLFGVRMLSVTGGGIN